MVFIRRRYYLWLIRAYIKKWKKTIISSVAIGIVVFFGIISLFNFYIIPLFEKKITKIGYAGAYTVSSLPPDILQDVSYGLTIVKPDSTIAPGAANKWEVENGEKEYVFFIKPRQFFHNGRELTAQNLPLEYKDVTKTVIDKYTVSYKLKNPYAPFLVSAAKPLLLEKGEGLGEYKMKKIDIKAGFIKSLTLQKKSDLKVKKNIYFYPTQEALKLAFMLGEVDTIIGAHDISLQNKDLRKWKRVAIKKHVHYSELVTVFYNNSESDLSNKKLRQALNFALPETFAQGERAYSPIPPTSVYFSKPQNYGISDLEIAKTLLNDAQITPNKQFEIATPPDFADIARALQKVWDKIGFKTKIVIYDELSTKQNFPPSKFQILVYKFRIPKDPDQYTLWHSQGVNNIADYRKNKRIDKLLEDGRQTTDEKKRAAIYADFQKYLIDDVPASFLYFPYEYTVIRE